jgi:hypothetical protein
MRDNLKDNKESMGVRHRPNGELPVEMTVKEKGNFNDSKSNYY